MHRTLVIALGTNLNYMLAACICVIGSNCLAEDSFVTHCQALVMVVDAKANQKIRLETFELTVLRTDSDDLIVRTQGDTHIEFLYATQASVLNQHSIRNMSVGIAKQQWGFQYQHVMPQKVERVQFSLNPITGAVRYNQVNNQQQTVQANGLCELPLQGKEVFIEAYSRNTSP